MQNPDKRETDDRPSIGSGQVEIVSRRAVAIGAAVSVGLAVAMVLWRIAARVDPGKKLTEFQFTVEQPEKEEFELKTPMRDIAVEQSDRMEMVVMTVEKPSIDMVVVPTEVGVVEEVAQIRNIEVRMPEIAMEVRDVDVDMPERFTEATEEVALAVDTAVAQASPPADIFRYDASIPADDPPPFTWNRSSKPVRSLTSLTQTFGDQESIAMPELAAVNASVFGKGDFLSAMTRLGGAHARSAVDDALQWLATHQEPDGHWAPEKHQGRDNEVGNSGLALLALLGGGHTSRRGEYRREVTKGLEWLLRQQQADGRVGNTMYEHAIATIAFSEASGRAQDERMGDAARRSVAWIERSQLVDGAWRYHPNAQFGDVSVTAWVIQALKAAKLAKVKFDTRMYAQVLPFVDTLTDRGAGPETSGAVGYTHEPSQSYPHSAYPAMTCAGMVIRQFSGMGAKSDLLAKGAALTRTLPPDWNRKNFYLWYYATYAMHYMGDENRIWWNRRIRDVLVENQARSGKEAGSWDPKNDPWAEHGGRIYTTALGALCLEVYYRYSDSLNGFGVVPGIDDLFTP